MAEPYVSVVTPIYNGEKYLGEAIESVLAQTYPFHEFILVDNCSTDQTPAILQHYASLDSRIRVIRNKKTLDIMDNHNLAMRQISGESKYCKVVHDDDLLFPHCIADMVALAEFYPSIGIVSSYRINGDCIDLKGIPFNTQFLKGREICRRTLLEQGFYVFGNPSSLLIRSSLLRTRTNFYPDNLFGDVDACFYVLKKSDFGFIHQIHSFTRLHEHTFTAEYQDSGRNFLGRLAVLIKHGPDLLTSDEYIKRLKDRTAEYYRFLGKNLLLRRENEFWAFQENWVSDLGMKIDRKRVVFSAIKVMMLNLTKPEKYSRVKNRWFRS